MAYSFHDELTPKPSSKANGDEKKETEEDDDDDEDEEEEEEAGGIIAMVPMADMLNHRTGFNNARLFHEPEAVQMRAIKDIQVSEQIYNTYGDLCNADLLRKYGFVDEPNDFDIVEISGDLVRDVSCQADVTDEEKDAKVSIKIYTMLL
jgi:SET domain-containing protein 6